MMRGASISTMTAGRKQWKIMGSPWHFIMEERVTRTELFPWDFIDIGVTKEFMLREYKRSLAEEVTPNCRAKCAGCGAAKFGCGVCVEARN